MIRCYWLIRPVAHRARHVWHGVTHGHGGVRHAIRHHKAAVVATLVCTVTAAPLGYGIGSSIWERGYDWSRRLPGAIGSGAVAGHNFNSGNPVVVGGQRFGAVTDERLDQISLPLGNVSVAPSPEPTPVPEPSSLALFAAAAALLLIVRRLAR